ncbi:MAG: hypothetical protein JRJ57_00185 [Deltaproteobacteria bacterium]|nr:hypothetical protein [Deltaproteobacteria bacterium]
MSKKLGYKVLFGADTSAYRREINKAKGYSKAFGNQVKTLGPLVASVFSAAAMAGFLKKSVEVYDIQAKAEASLKVALKGREDIMRRIILQAGELQRKTLFGDEQSIEAASRLAQILGEDEAAITRLLPLVQDLAQAKFGGNLVTAADLVAKSVGSSTNALSRYGIAIEGAVGSAERLESAIDALNEQVGGQAVAAAEAGTGAVIQLKNAWGDLREEIGESVAPRLTKEARWLIDLLEKRKDRLYSYKNIVAFGLEGVDQLKAIKQGESYGKWLFTSLTQGIDDYEIAIENVQGAIDTFRGHLKALEQQGRANEEQGLRYKAVIDALTESIEELQEKTKPASSNIPRAPGFTPVEAPWHGVTMGLPEDPFQLSNLTDSFDAFNPADILGEKLHDMRSVIEKNNDLTLQLWEQQFVDMTAIAEQGVEDMMINAFAGLGDLMSGDTDLNGFFDTILQSAGQFAKMMGSFIIAYGVSFDAIKAAFGNPFAAIAAGGALIAIGTAISNAANNPPDFTAGGSATYSPQASQGGGYYNTRSAAFNANIQLGGKIVGDGKSLKVLLDNVNNELSFTT